jgi:hypothetical protein
LHCFQFHGRMRNDAKKRQIGAGSVSHACTGRGEK